jgi:hypothetical protein
MSKNSSDKKIIYREKAERDWKFFLEYFRQKFPKFKKLSTEQNLEKISDTLILREILVDSRIEFVENEIMEKRGELDNILADLHDQNLLCLSLEEIYLVLRFSTLNPR